MINSNIKYNRKLRSVIIKLNAKRCHLPTVAKDTKMPYITVYKIARGMTERPRATTVDRLAKYFGIKL